MKLTIKPTVKCNFNCTFCSSTSIGEKDLNSASVCKYIMEHPEIAVVAITGGEPLEMCPSFYYDIIDCLDEMDNPAPLQIISNLSYFYHDPDKWTRLFLHPRVDVATSFNPDGLRIKEDGKAHSTLDFWKVMTLFHEKIGYKPKFFTVVTEDNAYLMPDVVRLAEEMETTCELMYAFASGRQGKPYPVGSLTKLRTRLIANGLEQHETGALEIVRDMPFWRGTSPDCRTCSLCLQPNGDYTCPILADDNIELRDIEVGLLKNECEGCVSRNICNECDKHILDIKEHHLVEHNCKEMKEAFSYLLTRSWL